MPLQNEATAKSFLSHFNQRIRFDPVSALNNGVDPKISPIETCPAAHTTIGGVRIDVQCATNLTGLYAAGSVAGGVYGFARPEGYTSMITLVFGRRAGLFAAEHSSQSFTHPLPVGLVNQFVEMAHSVIDNESGTDPDEVKSATRTTLNKFGWVIKDADGLEQGLDEIRRIRETHSTFKVTDGRQWSGAFEATNMLATAELLFLGSLERKESRGAFFRDDYPNSDDTNWMRNIVYKQCRGKPVLTDHVPDLKFVSP